MTSKESKLAMALASFVPETVKRYILNDVEDIKDLIAPMSQKFDTVALFADVSGFTALTEVLSKKGPVGAEEIGFFLNRYLERLVKVIARSGGDVFKFAGDAILVLWPPKRSGQPPTASELTDMVHRAAQCSLSIQEELHMAELAEDILLSVKLGIGVGPATVVHVGGKNGRLEYLPAGPSLMQAFRSEAAAKAGDTIMSIEAWKMVSGKFVGQKVNEHSVRVISVITPIRNIGVRRTQMRWQEASERLSRYVPAAVIPYLNINQKLWAAELRQITVVFVNLGLNLSKLKDTFDKEALDTVQTVISSIQAAVYQYEGSLNKFLVDDKGSTLLVVFGLPPLAHENDPARALLSSLQMHRVMSELGFGSSIGITSGLALCGLVGSGSRREYSVIGDLVNLSARLMQAANGDVLCDKATYMAARTQKRLLFRSLAPIKVKGKSELIWVYSPVYVRISVRRLPPPQCKVTIGRQAELEELSKLVTSVSVSADSKGLVAFLDGEIGVGKTHVLRELSNSTNQDLNSPFLSWGRGDPFHDNTAYALWRYMFVNMTGVGEFYDGKMSTIRSIVSKQNPELVPLLSSANLLLLTEFDSAEEEAVDAFHMENHHEKKNSRSDLDADRYEEVSRIAVTLLQAISEIRPLVLVLDECQWKSDADWHITDAVVNQIQSGELKRVSLVVSTRPLHNIKYKPLFSTTNPFYERIRKTSDIRLTLNCLEKEDVHRLLEHSCAVKNSDEQLISLIYERTGGRPLFCMKFMVALKHVKALIIHKESCRLSEEWLQRGEWDTELPIPYRIQRITASHLDRLTPSQMFVLKVASVISIGQAHGSRSFCSTTLRASHPISEYLSTLQEDINSLVDLEIIFQGNRDNIGVCHKESDLHHQHGPLEEENMDDSSSCSGISGREKRIIYHFSYGFLRDVIYQLMLYKQRQLIHRLVADYISTHIQKYGDIEEESIVLERHYILGVASTVADSSEFGARRSTVLPPSVSNMSGSIQGRKFRDSTNPSRSSRTISAQQPQNPSQWSLAWSRFKFQMRRFFTCSSDRIRPTRSEESAGFATQKSHQFELKIVHEREREDGTLMSEQMESSKDTSISILKSLQKKCGLDDDTKASLSFVLNTMRDSTVWSQAESISEMSRDDLSRYQEDVSKHFPPSSNSKRINVDGETLPNPATASSAVVPVRATFDQILDVSEEDLASLDMDAAKNLLDAFAVDPERVIGKDNCLSRIDQWDFDIFLVSQETNTQPLLLIGFQLFERYGMLQTFNIDRDTLVNFLVGIEFGYNRARNSYHNSIHAADVVQTAHVLLRELSLVKPKVSDADVFAVLTAAVIHDYRHPGQTNQFLLATEDEKAILFNDINVLENFHCTAAFRFMRRDKSNILKSINAPLRHKLRQQIIALVLATSLADHADFITEFENVICSNLPAKLSDPKIRALFLKMTVKFADISNACKPHNLSENWARGIMSEFYKQGDAERAAGLPVSRFMDRNVPSMGKCQTTFISYIVEPLFKSFAKVCPDLKDKIQKHLSENLLKWQQHEKEEGQESVAGEPALPGTVQPELALDAGTKLSLNSEPTCCTNLPNPEEHDNLVLGNPSTV